VSTAGMPPVRGRLDVLAMEDSPYAADAKSVLR